MAKEINDANYKELLESGMPVVIDFWAPWCGPCRSIAPIVEELATAYEGRAIIGKYNVDDESEYPHVAVLQGWQYGGEACGHYHPRRAYSQD